MNFGCRSNSRPPLVDMPQNGDRDADGAQLARQDYFMGTVATQQIFGHGAAMAYEAAVDEIGRLERLMSVFINESEISRLNQRAGKGAIKLSGEVIHVLEEARKYSVVSQGAFAITLGLLTALWRGCGRQGKIPAAGEINALLKYSGHQCLEVDHQTGMAALASAKTAVDLGGIGKGFAADVVIDIYRKLGVQSAFVDLGGNVKTLGRKPDGSDWVIGIQHPYAPRGRFLGALLVDGKSVVTSGGSERFFEVKGRKFHHILDPRTGWSAEAGLESSTVICENSLQADALSTAAFVMGLDKAMNVLACFADVEAVLVTKNKEVYITKGLQDRFLLSEQGAEFKLHVAGN